MKMFSKIAPVAAGVMALSLAAAAPADAQSRYREHRDNNDRTSDVLVGAAVGALAGALLGDGDGRYIAGGAVAGAAIGAASNNNDGYRTRDCSYYRGGRCYRNQGHWEREHGIDAHNYDRRYDRRDDRRDRDYRYDRRW